MSPQTCCVLSLFKIMTLYSWLCPDVTLWGWRGHKIQELTIFPGTLTEQTVSKFGTWWSDAERFNIQDRVAGRRGQHPSCSWSCRTAHCCKILMEFWKKKVLHNLFTQCTHSLFHAHFLTTAVQNGLKVQHMSVRKGKVCARIVTVHVRMCVNIFTTVCMHVCVLVCTCMLFVLCVKPFGRKEKHQQEKTFTLTNMWIPSQTCEEF